MVYVIQVMLLLASGIRMELDSYPKNKFEKLVHLVGFIIIIYHDARSPERQIYMYVLYSRHFTTFYARFFKSSGRYEGLEAMDKKNNILTLILLTWRIG